MCVRPHHKSMAISTIARRLRRRISWRASFGGHGHQPRTQACRVAQRSHLSPGDRPRSLNGLLGEVDVAAHDEAHACHVVVMGRDDPGEGGLVTGRGLLDDRTEDLVFDVAVHTL